MYLQTITLALLASSLTSPATQKSDPVGPPGLSFIEGGRTKVGTNLDDLKALLEEAPALVKNAGGFLAEIPEHNVDVEGFFLMTTEVTNEQYHVYVVATGAMPPHSWGGDAIDAARQQYLQEEGQRKKAARDAGATFEGGGKFEEAEWWAKNWKDAEFKVPEELVKTPVVFIDYQEARAYAEWSGLRLPTETEFERAVRGDKDRFYPWEEPFVPGKFAATNEISQRSEIFPVASFAAGATEQGIYDLAGNVWEWTSSRYVPYPNWKHKKFNLGKGKRVKAIDTIPSWSPDFRVVKSGSMQNSRYYARCTTRGGFDRFQKASALGFRCAASIKPGLDFAEARLGEIPRETRPLTERGVVEYDVNQVLARDRWHATDGGSTIAGYQVITGYDYILFAPAGEIPTSGLMDVRKGTETDTIFHIGFLSMNQSTVEPELAAGTYLIAIRGQGAIPERKEAPKAAPAAKGEGEERVGIQDDQGTKTEDAAGKLLVDKHIPFDPMVDNFIFIDMTGTPVAALPVRGIDYVNPSTSSMTVVDRVIMVVAEGQEGKRNPDMVELHQEWLELNLFIKGKSRKGLRGTLGLRFAEGLMSEGGWR